MQADVLTKVILPLSLFLIMFGIGISLRFADFKNIFNYPKAVVVGLIGQLILLPLIAFILALVFNLPAELSVGLIIIALAPGGATSNMFTYLFEGDVSLSVSLTLLTSLITPFTIPLLASLSMLYFMDSSTEFELPVVKTIVQLLVISVIPIALGMFALSRFPVAAKKIENVLKWFSIFFLFLIIGLIVMKNSANMASFFAQAGAATLVLNLVVLMLGYQLANWAKLNGKQSTAIGFEVGIQNGTLALVVAGTLIGNNTMMIPAVTYSLIMFFTGAIFGWLINKKNK
ncbi:MAG: BASS family bile acid:Na+ symporter [Gammaproteobacteria bacterium]|jgi:BASS family bile acid:Na+ symporter